ncbi:MAG: hypothetical protein K0S27_923 [Gammaproteobacteria bacterium]|jgi:predicted AAA+ superfamily ATPase|nr:hypothetical protein [Gammaproteobacteria bacterium]
MKRLYEDIIARHFKHYKQMLFLRGPRQVGKTTISLAAKVLTDHLNWDNQDHRSIILKGLTPFAEVINLEKITQKVPIVIF